MIFILCQTVLNDFPRNELESANEFALGQEDYHPNNLQKMGCRIFDALLSFSFPEKYEKIHTDIYRENIYPRFNIRGYATNMIRAKEYIESLDSEGMKMLLKSAAMPRNHRTILEDNALYYIEFLVEFDQAVHKQIYFDKYIEPDDSQEA